MEKKKKKHDFPPKIEFSDAKSRFLINFPTGYIMNTDEKQIYMMDSLKVKFPIQEVKKKIFRVENISIQYCIREIYDLPNYDNEDRHPHLFSFLRK